MDKRLFNKVVKREMLSYGFEKTGSAEYAKDAQDGMTKIVIRTPEHKGFIVGAQFTDYGKYNGKIADACVRYGEYELLLCAPAVHEYSEAEIISGVKMVMEGIATYLERGRTAIREAIEEWSFGELDERVKNEILAYFDLPTIDPYSLDYMMEKIDSIKRGGFILLSIGEYLSHREYYEQYRQHGCELDIDTKDGSVMIRFVGEKK